MTTEITSPRKEVSSLDLLNFIKANPKSTNMGIATKFNLKASSVSARTGKLYAQGRLSREVVGRTVSGIGVFGYTFVDYATDVKKTRENESVKKVVVAVPATTTAAKPAAKDIVTPMSHGQEPLSIDQSLHALADGLANALLGMVKARLVEQLGSIAHTLPESPVISAEELLARVNKPEALPKPKLKKVLVTGLLPQQQGFISQEFHDVFSLQFWNDVNHQSLVQLKGYCHAADVVFFHTAHCSHQVPEIIKSTGVEIIYVNGGLTAMKDAMTKWYVEGVKS